MIETKPLHIRKWLFAINRDERWLALFILVCLTVLNTMLIASYYGLLTPLSNNYWNLFINHFHVSGFDPITYSVVSDWGANYNVTRHPLLTFYMFVPYIINRCLMWLTGINCAMFVVAAMQMFFALYAHLFLYRILSEIIGISRIDATLLTVFFFTFGYVMLSCFMPDHFVISMMLLLMILYISGKKIMRRYFGQADTQMPIWQTVLLFLLSAGTSLNNGLKVFMSALFVNGRRTFRPAYLLLAIFLPTIGIWYFSKWEYGAMAAPLAKERREAKIKQRTEQRNRQREIALQQAHRDSIANASLAAEGKHLTPTKPATKPAAKKKRQWTGTPISNDEYWKWTDITTSRPKAIIDNLFGESIQLHQDYLLGDVMRGRPILVSYRYSYQYAVEGIIMFLFISGLIVAIHQRFVQMLLSWFLLDMALHIGLGFAINEVYIMAAQWIYIIPIGIALLMRVINRHSLFVLRTIVTALTLYLFFYNGALITQYLLF